MNIINMIAGALVGGSLAWVLGRIYGEGVGVAKSRIMVGKKAGKEDIDAYVDHKFTRSGFITKRIFERGLNDQLDKYIDTLNEKKEN